MKMQLLDCTLRDGGFLNKWNFGSETIVSFLNEMDKTCTDIIECGYIQADDTTGNGSALYSLSQHPPICSTFHGLASQKKHYCMVDYGKTTIDEIPDCSQIGIDGIRLAFHADDMIPAVSFCEKLKVKGYQIIAHPMNTQAYSMSKFCDMISLFSKVCPYAIYIVDSYGTMWPNELEPYISVADNAITKGTLLGFHFHNNLQQAMTNTVFVHSCGLNHDIILDASICGVGRGGGNLDFFPLLAYLNCCGYEYPLAPFWAIIDSSLKKYIHDVVPRSKILSAMTAIHHCHPNYGAFLADAMSLSYSEIDQMLSVADMSKLSTLDPSYIRQLIISHKEILKTRDSQQ